MGHQSTTPLLNGASLAANFTVSFWFKSSTSTGCTAWPVRTVRWSSSSTVTARRTSVGTFGARVAVPGATPIVSAFGPLNDGSCQNLTAIREAGMLHLYVDGVGAGSVRNATVLSGSLWAARHSRLGSLQTGAVDELGP